MGGMFTGQMFKLPTLTRLTIDVASYMYRPFGITECYLTTLEVSLGEYGQAPTNLTTISSLYSMARHIKVLLKVSASTKKRPPLTSEDKLPKLIRDITASASTLETLEIVPAPGHRIFSYDPLSSRLLLGLFTRLTKLVIPFRSGTDKLLKMLPPSLQELGFLHQTHICTTTLSGVIGLHDMYGNLRRFDLYCPRDDPIVLADSTWQEFKQHEISVFVWAISGNLLMKGIPVR